MASRYERTHAALQAAALRLMSQRGFDDVTVAEVAAAAGVTEMTAFRHFAVKEDLIVGDPYDPLIAGAIAEQPAELPALTRAARGLAAAWDSLDEPDMTETRLRVRLAAATPRLKARTAVANEVTERAVADALVEAGTDPTVARIAAAACLAAITAALFGWGLDESAGPLGARVRLALGVLEGAS
ncbi:TetR family transcriptional regulator [Agromyces sp. NPDC004153]